MSLLIRKFSRKRLGRRRQYHACIIDGQNHKELWRTSEGYNNRAERDHAVNVLDYAGTAIVFDVDEPDTTVRWA